MMNTKPESATGEGTALSIVLTQGKIALVDPADYSDLSRFQWRVDHGYARRSMWIDGRNSSEFMARRIMGLKTGDSRKVDHINHNTLDNRRANLRIVTNRENGQNLRQQSPHGAGIVYVKRNGKRPYSARALVHIGHFATKDQAIKARETWWIKYNATFKP